jgi:primary-amine oxidase
LEVKKYTAAKTQIQAIKFLTASILAPAKKDVLTYLGIPSSVDEVAKPERQVRIARRADLDVRRDSISTEYSLIFPKVVY